MADRFVTKEVFPGIKALVMRLINCGRTYKEIGTFLGCSDVTVGRIARSNTHDEYQQSSQTKVNPIDENTGVPVVCIDIQQHEEIIDSINSVASAMGKEEYTFEIYQRLDAMVDDIKSIALSLEVMSGRRKD